MLNSPASPQIFLKTFGGASSQTDDDGASVSYVALFKLVFRLAWSLSWECVLWAEFPGVLILVVRICWVRELGADGSKVAVGGRSDGFVGVVSSGVSGEFARE